MIYIKGFFRIINGIVQDGGDELPIALGGIAVVIMFIVLAIKDYLS